MTDAISTDHADAATYTKPRKRRLPSERNRHVFVEVVIRGREQPEVGREFGITQQRVSQIVEQFYGWLAENVPAGCQERSAEEQLRLAANVTYLRHEDACGQAMRNFERSREDKESLKIRYSAQGKELWRETTREQQHGKPGYLGVAIKACLQKWELVQMAAGLLGPAMEVEWNLGESATPVTERPLEDQARESSAPQEGVGSRFRPTTVQSQSPRPKSTPDPVMPAAGIPPRKVLCERESPRPERSPLAPASGAITAVARPDCVPRPGRKVNKSAVQKNLFKSCAKPQRAGLLDPGDRLATLVAGRALVPFAGRNHDLKWGVRRKPNCLARPPTSENVVQNAKVSRLIPSRPF